MKFEKYQEFRGLGFSSIVTLKTIEKICDEMKFKVLVPDDSVQRSTMQLWNKVCDSLCSILVREFIYHVPTFDLTKLDPILFEIKKR